VNQPRRFPVRFGADGTPYVSTELQRQMFREIPDSERIRRFYGRNLTPETIEQVLRQAEFGYMRPLTDLQYETFSMDPHLSSINGKRNRALMSAIPQVIPATGEGINPTKAKFYANVVREQLKYLSNLSKSIAQLNWAHCFGRAALEKIWKEQKGPIRWRLSALAWIHPRRLSFGPERELRVRDDLGWGGSTFGPQNDPTWGGTGLGGGFERRGLDLREIPYKFITFTPQNFNEYPEREGYGPRAQYWSFFKRFSQRERLILLEVYGKPWRIANATGPIQPDSTQEAQDRLDDMGANSSVVMPPGWEAKIEHPDPGSTEPHRFSIQDCDDQMSKLVLGQTRTTDAKSGALGSTSDDVAQEEQHEIFAADGLGIGECLSDQLALDIIAMNFGPDEIDHAPRIALMYERPRNRQTEAEVAKGALSMGLPLVRSEVYERLGYTQPQEDDDIVEPPAPPPVLPPGTPPPARPKDAEKQPADRADGESVDQEDPSNTPTLSAQPSESLLQAARVLTLINTLQHSNAS
jgi:phage gp29-like protein